MRAIIAGIGYRNLRDHSVGPLLVDRLAGRDWPPGVAVEDLSYGPIAVVQRFQDDPPGHRFDRAVVVSAVHRDRLPGSLSVYRWDGLLPSDEGVQRAVVDAVTGVIYLDNTLVVTRHFGVLPEDVIVMEVEPILHEFGDGFSAEVAAAFEEMCRLAAAFATDPAAGHTLAVTGLGGAPRAAETLS